MSSTPPIRLPIVDRHAQSPLHEMSTNRDTLTDGATDGITAWGKNAPNQHTTNGPLKDKFGRTHTALRISVTDKCNIRCRYCMPAEGAQFLPSAELLTFQQIATIASALAEIGIHKIRITGGEPLLRKGLPDLIEQLSQILEKVRKPESSLALTTNGVLLADQAKELFQSGLQRVNISLDTLNEELFQQISRRSGINKVLAGIDAALENGFDVRLNALLMKNINTNEAVDLVRFATSRGVTMRFIEFMPLDFDRSWSKDRMISGSEIRQILADEFGQLVPETSLDPSQPSSDYEIIASDGKSIGRVGFIDSVTKPFCSTCNRLRLTADGHLKNCLFGHDQWSLKPALSLKPESDISARIQSIAHQCVAAKKAAHGINSDEFEQPKAAMYQIGG